MRNLIGKTIAGVESKEIGSSDENAYEVVRVTCTDGEVLYFRAGNPSVISVFYATIEPANEDEWNCQGRYDYLKELD